MLDPENAGYASNQRKVTSRNYLDIEMKKIYVVVINFPFPPVIQGDVMSPDFIPSQPEGIYLYPLKNFSDVSFFEDS